MLSKFIFRLLALPVLICHVLPIYSGSVYSQTLHKFESSHGTEVQGVFRSYDPSTGNVELLILKSVPFDSLTHETQSLILALSELKESESRPLSPDNDNVKCPVWGYDRITDFPTHFRGLVLYTQGFMIWGVNDLAWFDKPMSEVQNGNASLASGTEKIPSGERVTLEQRATHPRTGKWIFQVRWRSKLLWVLSDSLGKERDSFRNALKTEITQGESQHPVLTDGYPNDVKYAFSIYAEPILAFSNSEQLNAHFRNGWIYPVNRDEHKRIGAITLSPNTKLKVIKRIQPKQGLNHYLVEPLDGLAIGKQLYVHPDDICDRPQ